MYSMIRFIPVLLIMAPCFLLVRKAKHAKEWRIAIAVAIGSLTFGLHFVPVENMFMRFDSLEEAVTHQIGKSSFEARIEGDTVAILISAARDGRGTSSTQLYHKDNGGWKIAHLGNEKTIRYADVGDFVVTYRISKETNEAIVTAAVLGSTTERKRAKVEDTLNSEFCPLFYGEDGVPFFYYVVIRDFPADYVVTVNGIPMSEELRSP